MIEQAISRREVGAQEHAFPFRGYVQADERERLALRACDKGFATRARREPFHVGRRQVLQALDAVRTREHKTSAFTCTIEGLEFIRGC
jgi:hypothetical protein